MVAGLSVAPGALVLDLAAGTGSITRELQGQRVRVVSLDQSSEMLDIAVAGGATGVQATAESLPFSDGTFDAVTFGYLLRYVASVEDSMTEVARVLRPGGVLGMVEFGRPRGLWAPLWSLYTRAALPAAGAVIGHGWGEVGRFLGPSIDDFARRYPPARLKGAWEAAGFVDVRLQRLSLGGGLVGWGRKP